MTSRGAVRWSWRALAVSSLAAGALLMIGIVIIAPFRSGLDADMNPMLAMTPAHVFMNQALIAGIQSLPFIVLGWWLHRLCGMSVRMFMVVTAAIPALLIVILKGVFMVMWLRSGTGGDILPFESNRLLYLPNYLEVGMVGGAFGIAAWVFSRVSRAVKT